MPLLLFLRAPLLFPAAADVLVGYLLLRFHGAGDGLPAALPLLVAASVLLTAAGGAWEHVLRLERDRRSRPWRPLPSHLMGTTTAFLFAATLSLAGLLTAMTAGYAAFAAAGLVLGASLLAAAGADRSEIVGGLLGGVARVGRVVLGMSAYPYALLLLSDRVLLLAPLLVALHETVTVFLQSAAAAAGEREDAPPERVVVALASAALAAVPLAALALLPLRWTATALFLAAAGLSLTAADGALRGGLSHGLRRLVVDARLGGVFLGAGLVAAMTGLHPTRSELAGIVLAASFILPSLLVLRRVDPLR